MTTRISQADLIESVSAALQYISYYHPADYIAHLARAYQREQSPAAKDAIAQILTNSKMSAMGHRPICQDTGIVNVFLKVGMDVRWEGFTGSLDDAINEGVRRGYNHPDNMLRASVVADPQFARKNTKDNTPAVIFTEIVPGNTVEVTVAAKGGGHRFDQVGLLDACGHVGRKGRQEESEPRIISACGSRAREPRRRPRAGSSNEPSFALSPADTYQNEKYRAKKYPPVHRPDALRRVFSEGAGLGLIRRRRASELIPVSSSRQETAPGVTWRVRLLR